MTTYSYFPLTGRLSTLNAYTVPAGQSIIYKVYDYNKSGDITGLHDLKNNIDYAYDYDPLHRLVSERSSGGGASLGTAVEVIEFTYAEEEGKPVHAPVQTSLNGASTQYTYTATGTRLNKQEGLNTTLYEVNYDNQIQTITAGGVATAFLYDADGKRIKKTQGSSTTLYFGEDLEIINNAPTLYAFAGNLRISKMTEASTEYYHKDHQGSTNAISDQNGTVVDTAEYLPYGPDRYANALLNHSAYKYTDQEQDSGTGLYNYDARLYDPVLGQFVMEDTIVPDPYNPQSLNRYAYCLNNPIRYMDPSGHIWFDPDHDGGESTNQWANENYFGGNSGGVPGYSPPDLIAISSDIGEKISAIQNAINQNYPDFKNNCSGLVQAVAKAVGIALNIPANNMLKQIEEDSEWGKTKDPNVAQQKANEGNLTVFGVPGEKHGHVGVVEPGTLSIDGFPSGTWGSMSPNLNPLQQDAPISKSFRKSDWEKISYGYHEID